MVKRAVYVVTAVLAVAATAHATSFAPYAERCVADPTGRFYVVVKWPDEGPAILTIAERRPGSPPVRSAEADPNRYPPRGGRICDPAIRVRDGDIVHGRFTRAVPPSYILVSSTGQAVVTLDVYGFNNLGPDAGKEDLVIYSMAGEVRHHKARMDLFDADARRYFRYIDGCVTWMQHAWLDERRGEVVVVGPSKRGEVGRPILLVALQSGATSRGGPEAIDRAIAERNPAALADALDLARELRLAGSRAAWPGIADDGTLPLGQRLRAAALLGTFGDRRAADLMTRTALGGAAGPVVSDDVAYAIEHLPDVLGTDALPTLKLTLRYGLTYRFAHADAFQSLGRAGVPTLVAVLEDDGHTAAQVLAAECLGFLGPAAEDAVPGLIRALRKRGATKDGEPLNAYAAWALGHIGSAAKAAIPDLERLVNEGDERARNSARDSLKAIQTGIRP